MLLYEVLGWIGAALIVTSIALLVGSFVDNALNHRALLRKQREYIETERRR